MKSNRRNHWLVTLPLLIGACSSHGETGALYQVLLTDCGQGGAAAAAGTDAGGASAGMSAGAGAGGTAGGVAGDSSGGMATAGMSGAGGAGTGGTDYTPVAPGAITGFGFDGQPRQWGTDGTQVKAALDLLVDDLGSNFARVEVNDGETTWETTNDNGDPMTPDVAAYDAMFSTPQFQHLIAYVRYLNQKGVENVELADHGGLPGWMGPSGSSTPSAHLATGEEDEWVETSVEMLLYMVDRAPDPKPKFTLFSPFNEPEFSPPEGFVIDPTTQGKRIIRKLVDRMNLYPELNGIKIVVSDSANEAGMITFRQAVQSDAVVQARLAATSFHRYSDADVWGTWTSADVPPIWLTEFNSTWQASCYTTTWSMGMQAAGNLISALQNGITAGLAWSDYDAPHIHQDNEWQSFGLLATNYNGSSNLCGAFNNTQPSDAILDSMTYTKKPTYNALRHGFKWIRRGAQRVTASDSSSSVDIVAYQNPDASVAVFGRNTSTSSVNLTVSLSMAMPPAALTPRTTTSTTTDVVGSPVTLTSGSGVFPIPGSSVFTLLSGGSGGSGGAGGSGGMSGAGGASSGGAGASQGGAGAGGMSSGGAGAGGQSGGAGSAGAGGLGGQGSGGAAAGSGGAAGSAGSSGLPPLVAGWAFNESSGTSTADASGNGHTGTLTSGLTWTTTGCKYGNCLSFPGTANKRVTVPDANDLDLNQTFTIMAWVQPSNTTPYRTVVIKEEPAGLVYLLYAAPKEGWIDIGGSDINVTASGTLPTNAFSHVAVMRNGTELSYWLNGSKVATTSVSGNTTASSGLLAIGGHAFWGGEWYAGKIDDVRIYASALTTAQMAQAMGAGL